MRRVDLNMDEQYEYEVIKKLVETRGNKNAACVKLKRSKRTINRMIRGYKEEGKSYFIHGNKGRCPAHTIPDDTKQLIIDLYNNKYYEASFTHYQELLEKHENIYVSESAIRTILMKQNILSPKASKATRRRIREELQQKLENSSLSKPEQETIQSTIVNIEDAHPRRPRCAYFGELIQMDASEHVWFGGIKCHLHIAVDDATSAIIGAYFDTQETLNGYYNVLYQILTQYGIPYKFLTDKRTVFEYTSKKSTSIEHDTFTQFGYACKQLGIELETTSVPQEKGRVERSFGTLKSRLPVEMRLAGVTEIEQANEFLNSYVKEYNKKFALPINITKSVFEGQPSTEKINLILAIIADRKIDNGHCIRFNNNYYTLYDEQDNPVYHRSGTPALVIKAFDGNLFASVGNTVYGLSKVEVRERYSKNFDTLEDRPKERKRHIPPMSHPWKRASFISHLKKQSHLKGKCA